MSLHNIVKEIEANRSQAEADVHLGSPNTYNARIGLKRAAVSAMERLKDQYNKELLASTVFIIVTGSARAQFTDAASNETFGCFSTDPEDFFKNLTNRIDPSLFGRESVAKLFNIAGNILYDKAMELGIVSYSGLSFSEKYNSGVKKNEDFVPIIRDAIIDQVGSEIVGINAVNSIMNKALEKRHSAKITPLILNTQNEKFALDLFKNLKEHKVAGEKRGLTPNVFLVIAGKPSKTLQTVPQAILVKNVTEASVEEALTAIQNTVL
jgi:hypothetical protein